MAHYRAACTLILALAAITAIAAQPTSGPTEREILVSVIDRDGFRFPT